MLATGFSFLPLNYQPSFKNYPSRGGQVQLRLLQIPNQLFEAIICFICFGICIYFSLKFRIIAKSHNEVQYLVNRSPKYDSRYSV